MERIAEVQANVSPLISWNPTLYPSPKNIQAQAPLLSLGAPPPYPTQVNPDLAALAMRLIRGMEPGMNGEDLKFLRQLSRQLRNYQLPLPSFWEKAEIVEKYLSQIRLMELHRSDNPWLQLWIASSATANARARGLVAEHCAALLDVHPDQALLGALLLREGEAYIRTTAQKMSRKEQPRPHILQQFVDGLSPLMGALLTDYWSLPDAVSTAVLYQNHPPANAPKSSRSLIQIIQASTQWSETLLFSPLQEALDCPLFPELGIKPALEPLTQLRKNYNQWYAFPQ